MTNCGGFRAEKFQPQPDTCEQRQCLQAPGQQPRGPLARGDEKRVGIVIHFFPPFFGLAGGAGPVSPRAAILVRTSRRSSSVRSPVSTRCSTSEAADPPKTCLIK